ncbi:MAG: type IV secretory system conjugative DNA transfer family protein, partial [Patescibacteria group bacterium]
IPAIQNKIGQFTSNPLIRNIIGQPKSSFDIRKVMDEKKILIVNLSKGLVGEGNANLLGSMLVTKIYLAAMSRADSDSRELKKLPNFYLYADEFQSFANKSFADILSEARKYKLSLNITHQYIEQMAEEVRAAVFGNVGTMIAFRVGSYDAEVLEKEFAPVFVMEDIVNLGFVQIYLKLMIDGVASQPFSAVTLPPISPPAVSFRDKVMEISRKAYAHPKAEVEKMIKEWHQLEQSSEIRNPKSEIRNERPEVKRESKFDDGKPREYSPEKKFESRSQPQTRVESAPIAPKPPAPKITEPKKTLADAIAEAVNNKPNSKEEIKKVEPVSLNVLAQDNKKKDKGPTEQNKNALKEALEKAMKEEGHKPPPPPLPEGEGVSKPPTSKNEIPEDVLRKVLKGE